MTLNLIHTKTIQKRSHPTQWLIQTPTVVTENPTDIPNSTPVTNPNQVQCLIPYRHGGLVAKASAS